MALSKFDFLVESIKNWKKSGTITQSSPYLCKKMVKHLDPKKHHFVAEFGTGDGVITRHILDRLHPDGKLLAFEINESMFDHLATINDPRLIAIYDSAENIEMYMKRENIPHFDSIISSIPFVVLPTELSITILSEAKKTPEKRRIVCAIQLLPYPQRFVQNCLSQLYFGIRHPQHTTCLCFQMCEKIRQKL